MAERYKLEDIDNERFFQIPKSLVLNPEYHNICNTSKIIYAILKDRMCLSREKGWHDDNGDIYLLCDQQKLADSMGTSRKTINRAMKELKDIHLIDIVRQGAKIANKIYINRPLPFKGLHQNESDGTKMSQRSGQKCPTNDTDTVSDTESIYNKRTSHQKTKKQFIPPTLEEVKAYIDEKRLNVDAQKFFDYYEAGDWHDGNGKAVKSWKQKCLTWDKHDTGGHSYKDGFKAERKGNGQEFSKDPRRSERQTARETARNLRVHGSDWSTGDSGGW